MQSGNLQLNVYGKRDDGNMLFDYPLSLRLNNGCVQIGQSHILMKYFLRDASAGHSPATFR